MRQDKDVPEDGTDGKATVTYLPYLPSYRDSTYVVDTLGSGHRIDVASFGVLVSGFYRSLIYAPR